MDVQQSTAWKTFNWAKSRPDDIEPLNLVVSMFIDWFNPCGNKLSGKKEILGVILLNCLNLPPHLHDNPEFSLVYAIIPGPDAPSVITISNCMKLLVDELLLLPDGIKIPTSQLPLDCQGYLQLLPIHRDLLAIHKVVGFGSPSASQFCAWCTENSKKPAFNADGTQTTWFHSVEISKGVEKCKDFERPRGTTQAHRD
ncbi:hypothetical protein O181_069079 [Austropuccinia psidii MF-1]|uniref:Uncharacterized protein n=1 Tax=Austropuccinia psidii MF-1 TaxID=1389203 RepID=A0A9Q3EY52_9BASI|nr:hypothetical protein [Austropuccinia psidii MF-1]